MASGGWPDHVSLRALQTNFIAPVEQGVVTVSVHVLREGKTADEADAFLTKRGLVLRARNVLVDASVKRRLEELRRALIRTPLPVGSEA